MYDGRTANLQTRTVFVVGVQGGTARILAKADHASRSPLPAPACPSINCTGPLDPPYVSTSSDAVYVLDGDRDVKVLGPDGSLTRVTSTRTAGRAGFAVSPDDSLIAVGDASGVYVEKLHGGGHVDVMASNDPVYWPVGWHAGKIVLAYGHQYLAHSQNPYQASGYALVDPDVGAKPMPLGTGDCVPSGTLTAAGTACIKDPGTPCLENEVANPESTPYYNSCLRRIDWSGTETNFLLPNNSYTSSFTVAYAALSVDGQQILTDQLGTVFAPSSPTHGGNDFLGSYHVTVPPNPSMGWLDYQHYSFAYVYPDGVTRDRITNATFEGVGDAAPGVPGSPVTGELVALLPSGL